MKSQLRRRRDSSTKININRVNVTYMDAMMGENGRGKKKLMLYLPTTLIADKRPLTVRQF